MLSRCDAAPWRLPQPRCPILGYQLWFTPSVSGPHIPTVNLNRKTVALIIAAAITLMAINVTYTGITAGVGLTPSASFLLWTIIALACTTQEEVGDYIRQNHHKVTVSAREQALILAGWTREATSPPSR